MAAPALQQPGTERQAEMRDPADSAGGKCFLRVAHVEAGECEGDRAGAGGDDGGGQPRNRDRGHGAEEDEGVAAEQPRREEHREEERRGFRDRGLLERDRGRHQHPDRERPARDAPRAVGGIAAADPDEDDGTGPGKWRDHQALRNSQLGVDEWETEDHPGEQPGEQRTPWRVQTSGGPDDCGDRGEAGDERQHVQPDLARPEELHLQSDRPEHSGRLVVPGLRVQDLALEQLPGDVDVARLVRVPVRLHERREAEDHQRRQSWDRGSAHLDSLPAGALRSPAHRQ